MDKVRFGRALGYGARHAAKTLSQAVDAATTPTAARTAGRAAAGGSGGGSGVSSGASSGAGARSDAGARVAAAARGVAQAKAGSKELRRSVMAPVKTFSSVLWLQVTGTFFTLVAVSLGGGLWRMREAAKMSLHEQRTQEFYVCAGMFVLFAYFAVSNFVRAKKREKLGSRR